MLSYIARRLLLMVPTLIGVTAVVFFVMALAPGESTGLSLNPEGDQTQGQDARRALQYVKRRYGLDKPVGVQYLRWLNQISPVGFETSDDVRFDEAMRDRVAAIVRGPAQIVDGRQLESLVGSTLQLAAYRGEDPAVTAEAVARALEQPVLLGMEMIRSIGEDTSLSEEAFGQSLASESRARTVLLQAIVYEANSRSRVMFGRPTVKWPDLGVDKSERPVMDRLAEAVPITILLSVITIPIIYLVSIFAGVYAARHRGGLIDLSTGTVMLGLWSFPTIGAGVLLIVYFASVDYLHWFPTGGLHSDNADMMTFLPGWGEGGFERGWLLDMLWHMVLPIVCLTYGGFAVLTKLTRGAILDNLSQDYARTARAKGVSERDVLWRHVFRNSLLPLITVAASILPSLIVGSVVVENIFSIQGMGKLGVDAAFEKDRELILGTTLIGGLIGLTSELIRDVCYAIADPRVSYD